jgi:putative endonuclease
MEDRKKDRLTLGKAGEDAAARFLRKKGFKILERGFRLFRGEIDIIGLDRKTLVFVEVKTRTSEIYGYPEESVTYAKQNQLRKIAEGYIQKKRLGDCPCRFDAVSVLIEGQGRPRIRHIENAF